LFQRTVIAYIGTALGLVVGLLVFLSYNPEYTEMVSKVGGNVMLFSVIIAFIALGIRSRLNLYNVFIDGAKGGFDVAIKIVPFLVAILVAVAVFRASGAMELLFSGIKSAAVFLGATSTDFIDALPTAFMKPFSGGAARGMMLETFTTHGVDSFAGKLASTFQGSTDTTFYILSVYFGSVGIKNSRYAAGAGLIADFFGIAASIFVAYLFYN